MIIVTVVFIIWGALVIVPKEVCKKRLILEITRDRPDDGNTKIKLE